MKKINVALVGNPNCGKTTLFNKLTRSFHKVANYPGVTVDIREGSYKYKNQAISFVDLPGIYSLSVHSKEEIIARDYILRERPDFIVNIVDACNLENSLYLTTELMELEVPIILVLNKMDLAEKRGVQIDVEKLSKLLEVTIVETVGAKSIGIEDLLKVITSKREKREKGIFIPFSKEVEESLKDIELLLENDLKKRWKAIKLLENEGDFKPEEAHLKELVLTCRKKIEKKASVEEIISRDRHRYISQLVKDLLKAPVEQKDTFSDKIDRFILNRFLGIPIFLVVIYLVFQLTFSLGAYPTLLLEDVFDKVTVWILKNWQSQSYLRSLLVDGIISGVGSVLAFVPNILLLFIGISLLEESGYMARVAYLMDRIMHKIGLHGRSFLPFIIGFGCTVPAIMSTRILENKRDRLTTILVLPFISCSAKLAVFTLLIPSFFSAKEGGIVLFLLYFIGIFLAIVFIKIFRKTLFKGSNIPFIMDMPSYQVPSMKCILISTWDKAGIYVKKAGTFILAFSIVFWFLSVMPKDSANEKKYEKALTILENSQREKIDKIDMSSKADLLQIFNQQISTMRYVKNFKLDLLKGVKEKSPHTKKELGIVQNEFNQTLNLLKEEKYKNQLEYSFIGRLGRIMQPIFQPLGFDWKIDTALLGALSAKEVFISQLSIIFSVGGESSNVRMLQNKLKANYTPIVGFCILLFMLISAPCIATIAMTKKETSSYKWAFFQIAFFTILAYVVTLIVFQTSRLF